MRSSISVIAYRRRLEDFGREELALFRPAGETKVPPDA
jgi:hypothetical protein